MIPTPQHPVTIPQTGDGMNVTLLFALTLVQRLAAEAAYEYHISTRHASLTARFVACLFLHTQICGKNITLRGVFLIDKLPPRSKIDINMYKVHKFLSTT